MNPKQSEFKHKSKISATESNFVSQSTYESLALTPNQAMHSRVSSEIAPKDIKKIITPNDLIAISGKTRKNLENLKLYPFFSDKTITLRSKLLLRDELKRNFNSIHKDLSNNIKKAKEIIQGFNEIGNEITGVENVDENDLKTLKDLNNQIFYLEREINEVKKEKKFLNNIYDIDKKFEEFEREIINNAEDSLELIQY